MKIIIDQEFQQLIPPLSADEYTQLEKNILKDGIRDAIVVWPQKDGSAILVDGHNRYKISQSHHGISFQTSTVEFADRDEAIVWIINNQLGKRNISKFDRITLEDKKREILARQAKKEQGKRTDLTNIDKKSCQSPKEKHAEERQNKTDYKIAKAADTSEDTVRKVRKINELATDKTKQLVRDGKLSINQAYNSVHPKQPNPVKQAQKEHDEFVEEKRENKVTTFEDVQTDRLNQEILNTALKQEILKLLNDIDKFAMTHTSSKLKEACEGMQSEEKKMIADRCDKCVLILSSIRDAFSG